MAINIERLQDALISALPYVQDAAYNDDNTELGRQRAQAIADEINKLIRINEAEIEDARD